MQIQTLSVKNKSNWLPLLLALACWSCGQNKTTSESVVDSLMIQKDAAIIKATGYPNVYEIPSDYPWLVRLIGQRFPWDSAGTCSRVTAFNSIFPEASTTSDQIEDDLVTEYSYKDSFIKVSQLSFKEMQDCMDNICEVVLTSDWVPIGLGLNVGMTKSRFLEALSLNKSLTQNIYNYVYKVDDRNSIQAVFEFQDELMSLFSYKVTPCTSGKILVPQQPFFAKLFNKPFQTDKPDSVQKMIKTTVSIGVERDNQLTMVDKISESDVYAEFRFDSSLMKFEKWPEWQIIYADLKSPHFSFSNGLKVGMTRVDFLKTMGEPDFEGDEFNQGNQYCGDGFKNKNNMTVIFKAGVITSIQYSRGSCN